MDHRPSAELLESNHTFPGVYQIKAIGTAGEGFEERVLDAVRAEVASASEIDHQVRATPGGRHVSLTMDVTVQTAEQVRAIYARIHEVKGLTMLL